MHGIPPSSGRVAPCVQGIRSDVEKGLVHQDTAESHRTGSMWFQNVFFKQEPAEYDRDDSGINSGNEFQASSPEGDGSQDGNTQDTFMQLNVQLGIDRLKMIQKQSQPNSSPAMESGQAEDILRNLREAMELSRMLTQIPDEVKGTDMEKDNKRANEKISKKKTKSCKTCGFVPEDEDQYYKHIETHMRPSKVLRCHFCKFVTEFKHHLEYHLCQHSGKKQFKCEECGYECINKSMLSSHLKSHSRIYQYHCADCTYSTKYQHALKEHLKKYTHKPALVLNPDGTPNPLIIIDVYGKRRGPKLKQMPIRQEEPSSNLPLSPLLLNNQQFAKTQQQQTPNQRSTLFQPPLMPQHLLLPFMFPNGQPFPLTTAFPLMGDIHKAYATSLMITQALHQQMQAQSPQSQPASSPIPSSHSRAVSPWGFDTDVEPSSPISDAGSEVLDLTVKRPKN